jgi:hypothetical protein
MRIERDNNNRGKCREGTYAYADIKPDAYSASKNSTILEGKSVAADTGRISRIKSKILGTAFVGERIFLCESRCGNARNDTGIYRTSI